LKCSEKKTEEKKDAFYTLDISNPQTTNNGTSEHLMNSQLSSFHPSNCASTAKEQIKYPITKTSSQEEDPGMYVKTQASTEESVETNILLSDVEFSVRIGFIRKVYGILLMQMVFTFLLTCLSFIDVYKAWYINHSWIVYVGMGLNLLAFLPLCFCRNISRKVPVNYLLLACLTIGTSIILTFLCANFTTSTVLIAWTFAIGMALALTAYTYYVKISFNYLCAMGFVLVFAFLFFGLFAGVMKSYYFNLFYCFLGAMIYGLFLVLDTKLIIGDNAFKYNVDDYILASLNLYFDIIMIFMYAISALGGRN